jgi:hypothetical protein
LDVSARDGLKGWVVGIASRPRRVDGFPIDLRQRRAGGEAFDQIGVGEGIIGTLRVVR